MLSSAERSSYLVTNILTDETLLVFAPFVPIVVLPSEERETRNDERNNPHGSNHEGDAPNGPLLDVVDARHSPVSIDRIQKHLKTIEHVHWRIIGRRNETPRDVSKETS